MITISTIPVGGGRCHGSGDGGGTDCAMNGGNGGGGIIECDDWLTTTSHKQRTESDTMPHGESH